MVGKTNPVPCVCSRSSFHVPGPCRFHKSNFNFLDHRVVVFFASPKTPKRSINTTLVPCTQRTQLADADSKFHCQRGCLCRNGTYSITARLPRLSVFVVGKTKSVPCVRYRSSFRVQRPCCFHKSNFNFLDHRVVVFSASPKDSQAFHKHDSRSMHTAYTACKS